MSAARKTGRLVDVRRWRSLNSAGNPASGKPVIYWMSRDQRVLDNWALLATLEAAEEAKAPAAVCFNVVPEFLGAGARQFGFMLRGLREVEKDLADRKIPFFLLRGDPEETVPELVERTGAGLLICDYAPLRLGRKWRDGVAKKVKIPVREVDAHNVVPVWEASDKREHAARTIRPKIHRLLSDFLVEYPPYPEAKAWDIAYKPTAMDWDRTLADVLERGKEVPEVTWAVPGEKAARAALLGDGGFLTKERVDLYEKKRNDPGIPKALSNLSPYYHFGQLAPQRAALEAVKYKKAHPGAKEAVDGYLEEMIVRRELSDNFCHYEPNYDNLAAAAEWARETLRVHEADPRDHLYSEAQLDKAQTHDDLWNAAQLELVHRGKMHGFMRMYWCKKILEWTPNAAEALRIAIYLNDRYSLDGRDPSGYVGCMWSICGIHDMGWTERAIFGKIRYMNYAGCKRKFDIQGYVNRIKREVKEVTGLEPKMVHGAAAYAAAVAKPAAKRKQPAAAKEEEKPVAAPEPKKAKKVVKMQDVADL